jgi:hypothetical protein
MRRLSSKAKKYRNGVTPVLFRNPTNYKGGFKVLKTIKLTKEDIEFIKAPARNITAAQTGFQEACEYLYLARKQLWEEVNIIYPECSGKGKRAKFDSEKWEIVYNENKNDVQSHYSMKV